jgi:hypothetical protein
MVQLMVRLCTQDLNQLLLWLKELIVQVIGKWLITKETHFNVAEDYFLINLVQKVQVQIILYMILILMVLN